MEVLFAITFLSTYKEVGDDLVLDFNVTDLILYDPMFFSDFFNFFKNNFDNTVFSIVLFYTLQCFEFFCSRCAWLT